MAGKLHINDLPPEARKRVQESGMVPISRTRTQRLKKEDIKKYAIKVLAQMADLTVSERDRVLDHAREMNNS